MPVRLAPPLIRLGSHRAHIQGSTVRAQAPSARLCRGRERNTEISLLIMNLPQLGLINFTRTGHGQRLNKLERVRQPKFCQASLLDSLI